MSIPNDIAESEAESAESPPQPKRRWPWLVLLAALPLVAAGLLTGFRVWSERQQDRGIASATLPDGSQVIVEAVSVGRVHTHVMKKGTRLSLPILRSFGTDPMKSTLTTNADRILIFFRHVGPDGKARDLHWWRAHVTTADDDEELWNDEGSVLYLRDESDPNGGTSYAGLSSVHGTLGFDTPPKKLIKVVGVVELPVSAVGGPTIPLRLLNEAEETMASLTIPVSLPPIPSTWLAEELPIRKTFGGVDVTLKSVTAQARPITVRNKTRAHYSLDRRWEVTESGQPAGLWQVVDEWLSDESGESGLPPKGAWKSPVWRLSATLVPVVPDPPPELASLPSTFRNTKEFASVAVPARDTMAEVSQTILLTMPETNQSIPLNIDRVGAGNNTWSGTGPRPHSHGRGLGSTDAIGEFNVNSSHSSDDWSLRIMADGAWFRLTHNRLRERERLEFSVTDDQGRVLKSVKHPGGRDLTWVHIQPLPDSKNMTLRVYPLSVHLMEFYFEPPSRPRLEAEGSTSTKRP